MPDTQVIDNAMLGRIKALGLPEVKENNQWLVVHIKGDGRRAPKSWNAKVYRNSAGDMKLVTTDIGLLGGLLKPVVRHEHVAATKDGAVLNQSPHGSLPVTHQETVWLNPQRVISIDDSGWGFPVGGVLFGIHDSLTGKVLFTEVKVEFFQASRFENKEYLEQAAIQVAVLLDEELNIKDESNVVYKICTGYVNNGINLMLRKRIYEDGYQVKREAIGEPLQSALEAKHREYIKELVTEDIYYDPKEMGKSNIGRAYNDVMAWIQKNNAWHLAKTGWKSMAKYRRQ